MNCLKLKLKWWNILDIWALILRMVPEEGTDIVKATNFRKKQRKNYQKLLVAKNIQCMEKPIQKK